MYMCITVYQSQITIRSGLHSFLKSFVSGYPEKVLSQTDTSTSEQTRALFLQDCTMTRPRNIHPPCTLPIAPSFALLQANDKSVCRYPPVLAAGRHCLSLPSPLSWARRTCMCMCFIIGAVWLKPLAANGWNIIVPELDEELLVSFDSAELQYADGTQMCSNWLASVETGARGHQVWPATLGIFSRGREHPERMWDYCELMKPHTFERHQCVRSIRMWSNRSPSP